MGWWDNRKLARVTRKTLDIEASDMNALEKVAKQYRNKLPSDKRKLVEDQRIVDMIDRAEKDFKKLMKETEVLAKIEALESKMNQQKGVWGKANYQKQIADLAKKQKITAADAARMTQRLKNEIAFIRNALRRTEKELAIDIQNRENISNWLEKCEGQIINIQNKLGLSFKAQIGRVPQ